MLSLDDENGAQGKAEVGWFPGLAVAWPRVLMPSFVGKWFRKKNGMISILLENKRMQIGGKTAEDVHVSFSRDGLPC